MKFVTYLLLFLFFIAMQSIFPFSIAAPNLPFLFFFCIVSLMEEVEGLITGFVFGFVMDAVANIVFGYHMLAYGFTAYLLNSLRNRQLLCQKYEMAFIILVISIFIGMSQISLIGSLALPTAQMASPVHHAILLRIFLDALFTTIAFWVLHTPIVALNTWFASLYERSNSRRKRRYNANEDDPWS